MQTHTSACGDTWTEEKKAQKVLLPLKLIEVLREFALDKKNANLTIHYKEGKIVKFVEERHHHI